MTTSGDHTCPICGNQQNNRVHLAREMMFGMRDSFHYLECASCGCLSLIDMPSDMAKYYPRDYYSFAPSTGLSWELKKRWAACSHGQWNPVGWFIKLFVGSHVAVTALHRAEIPFAASVLDVGCGNGLLLRYMKHLGYRHVVGVDPYIDKDVCDESGVLVVKSTLAEMRGEFDLVMFHHSFEHMVDQVGTLKEARRLLKPGGRILIRLPVAGSYAWKQYGVNWMNLDAPRHFHLHTPASMRLVAQQAGLLVAGQSFEGTAASLVGSELYAEDVALVDHAAPARGGPGKWRLWRRARKLRSLSDELNRTGQGDCACFELRVQPAR